MASHAPLRGEFPVTSLQLAVADFRMSALLSASEAPVEQRGAASRES